MGLDTSIYANSRPIQIEAPNPVDSMTKALTLSNLSLQHKQIQQQAGDQDALKAAYIGNLGPDGVLNRGGVLSKLKDYPMLATEQQGKWTAQDAAKADQNNKILQDNLKKYSTAYRMASTATTPEGYERMKQQMVAMGLPTDHLPPQFDPAHVQDLKAKAAMMTLDTMESMNAMKTVSEVGINEKKAPLERAKTVAETDKLKADTGGQKTQLASHLRQERSGLPTTKATQEISAAYNKIQEAAKAPSAAGDMSMIFGFMKLLDPGSTVREGEQASAQNAAGVPTQVMNLYNKIRTGERLAPEQRADFLNQANGLYSAQISQQRKVDENYRRLAIKSGASPDDVLLNFDADQPNMLAGKSSDDLLMNSAYAADKPSQKIIQKAQAAKMPPADFVKATAKANGIDEATAARLLEKH